MHEARVGGNVKSRFDFDDVTRYQIARGDAGELAVADDRGPRHLQVQERVHRAARAVLGHEPDQRVDDEHRRHGRGFDPVAEQERNDDGRDEQVDNDAAELRGQDAERGHARCGRQGIRSSLGQAGCGLRAGEARRPALQLREAVVGGPGVPG